MRTMSQITLDELLQIKVLFLDFDGVLTDNHVIVSQSGEEFVRCSRLDGLGISRLREFGLDVQVVSSEKNPVVTARCRKLGVGVQQGVDDKVSAMVGCLSANGLTLANAAFVGNDINDIAALSAVPVAICVADRVKELDPYCHFYTERSGGMGAVREVCDVFLKVLGEGND